MLHTELSQRVILFCGSVRAAVLACFDAAILTAHAMFCYYRSAIHCDDLSINITLPPASSVVS